MTTLPVCVQSSTQLSRSQAWEKEEGWRQEGHPDLKEVAPKLPCMKNLAREGIGEDELEEIDWGKTSNLCVAWQDDKR